MRVDVYLQRMQSIYSSLGGGDITPPSDEKDPQGYVWHQIFLILGGNPALEPPVGGNDVFGFWLQQIYIGFGGSSDIWPPADQDDPWGWWFQQICAILGNPPNDWPPPDEKDCLNWWLLKLIDLSLGRGPLPIRFYTEGSDLYVNITKTGQDMGVSEDQFEIDENGDLQNDSSLDLEIQENDVIWNEP
jgi:hypothetical protein